MKRRLSMALPLIFAFVLTLLPFGLLEYNQHQRNSIHNEREITRWEQSAGNYMQLFRSLWSLEMQIARRFFLLNKSLSQYQKSDRIDADNFMAEIRRYFPPQFMPGHIYCGVVSSHTVDMFEGRDYTRIKQRFFKRILEGLCRDEKSYNSRELESLNASFRGAFGDVVDFELIRNYRSGKISPAVYEGKSVLLLWDSITMASGQRLIYLMIFSPKVIDRIGSMQLASSILGRRYSSVSSVLVPLRHADRKLQPIFDQYLDEEQRSRVIQCVNQLDEPGKSRDRLLPPGKFVNYNGLRIMREFIDYAVPYEIWVMSRGEPGSNYREPFISFVLRLFFYTAWILVFAQVLITGNPVGISLKTWLTLTFMVVGVLPLLVFYVAGLFHVDASAFRLEQEAIKDALQQLEEADTSGEELLTEYHNFCLRLENDPEWISAMTEWSQDSWNRAINALPAKFAKAGLSIDAAYVYPPNIASLSSCLYRFSESDYSESREHATFRIYGEWVNKAYFNISPQAMIGSEPELQMFRGRSGKEIMRYFISNRGDLEFVDFSEEKYFIYQNFLMKDSLVRNWYVFRISISRAFKRYLRESVSGLQNIFTDNIYAISEIKGSQPTIVLPAAGSSDERFISSRVGPLIELAAINRTSMVEQNDDHLMVVYPCVKSGPYILSNLVFFKNFRVRAYQKEIVLSYIVVLMAIPVLLIARLTAEYLVKPLQDVETGLTKISTEDDSQQLRLKREDELGRLSLAFDKMLDGIRERRNLGRFVSASLDRQVAMDERAGHTELEGRFGAILCSDIRSFTTLSERYPVRDIVAMLNEHLAAMSSCIKAQGGMVEQFVGDAIIAIFYGESLGEAAEAAVHAAVAMNEKHRQISELRAVAGQFAYAFGVGIEVGHLLSGTVKAGNRYEYLVVGDARVRAETLEAFSKKGMYTKIMVSEKVYALTRGLYDFVKSAEGDVYEMTDITGGRA
ncbi:MAG: hypothetical protein CVV42_08675 [Candidatus Riflebacteria bacterium HGW-Riflebacteria-2]|jgi:class 3 adenylate cyclase|nr:MAG: hypothetical protein CVV42_08675 [Candidatus Riflebacteria bacterium HGW-Riflebacteria-2]